MYSKLFNSRKKQILYYLNLLIMMVVCTVYMVYTQHYPALGSIDLFERTFVVRDFPIMILAGLWGFVPAMISFAVVLLDSLFIDASAAYSVTVYLMAAMIYYQFSLQKWYRRKGTTIIAILVAAGLLGGVWNIVDAIATQQGIFSISTDMYIECIISVMPEILASVFLLWIFFNKSSKRVKKHFFMGIIYDNEAENEDVLLYQQQINSRLSQKLTTIIVIEALFLGVASAVFCSQLIPSMADNILSSGVEVSTEDDRYDWTAHNDETKKTESGLNENESTTNESTTDETTSDDSDGDSTANVTFLFNNAGVAFIVKMMILMFNVSVPLIVLANAYVQNRIARPIISMSSTVKNFAGVSREEQDEKLREMSRMNIRGNDEIAVLYDNMAEMAYQINSFVDQVVREQKLQEDLRVAQIASENKSNFLNNVSHEIRTPINAVLGLDEMILRESKEENIIEYAKDIQNSGKTLLSLVNDILDSSKLESGKMEILPVEYDVSSVINDIVNMIGVRAKDKHLGFELHVDSKIPHILYGDEIRIKQVIVNILTNAVKYTEKGQVDFTLGFEKENEEEISLICKVKDTGIGIKKEDMDKLFSRFERIDEGRNRTIEGTGLGMNIVKQLLALMDSELEVESEYGVGSEFSFKVRQKVVSWDEMGDYAESYRRFVKNEHYKESFIAPDAIVLVTDDTVMNLTVFKALLKTTKVQIDTAESGFETLDKVKEKKYDIIFLDHRMPQMDGIETLQKMKELEGNLNTDTPVISLTANAVSGARETYMAAGFADYLSKPIDSKKLEHMIVDYLPKEKLIIESGDIAESNDTGESGEKEIIKSIRDQSALNLEEAFLNCGGEETFVEVLKEYVGSAEKKAGDIESFWQNLDYENYTVLVHALKSSSRLIGAGSLSEDAKELETLGNEAAAGNEDAKRSINEKTPALLEAYRSLYQSLSFVLGNDSEEDKPKIDLDGFKDGMNTIKEFVEAFDFDSADSVVKMLDMYQIPKEYKEGFAKVKEALSAVDQQLLIEKIREMGL